MISSQKIFKYYKSLALMLLNAGVLFVLVNLVLFAFFKIKDNYLANNPVSTKYGQSLQNAYPDLSMEEIDGLLDETWRRGAYLYEPFTQFKERPYHGKYVNVDEGGFRVMKNQGPWPPDRNTYLTVFVFGGSTAFGYGVPDDQTIAQYLQEFLSSAGLKREARVYNFGRAYYYSTQERVLFEKLLLSGFVPDMAIFIDGINEFLPNKNGPHFTTRLEQLFDKRSMALYGLLQILKTLPITRAAHPLKDRMESISRRRDSADLIDRYTRNKKMIESVASAFGAQAVFVWQPSPAFGYDLKNHPFAVGGFQWLTFSESVYPEVLELADDNVLGRNFLWCVTVQEGITEPLYVDEIHYSADMSKRIAKCIVDRMLTRKLLTIDEEIRFD